MKYNMLNCAFKNKLANNCEVNSAYWTRAKSCPFYILF